MVLYGYVDGFIWVSRLFYMGKYMVLYGQVHGFIWVSRWFHMGK